MGVKRVTVRQALQHVADNPVLKTDDLLQVPISELISRTLFDIANGAQLRDRKSMTHANVARNMIFQRLVGRRRAGSHPATKTTRQLQFKDLAGGGS
jgi:hypothetical protein